MPSDFTRTYQAHYGLVFRTAYRITGTAAEAEDVLQTVFLRLLRRDPATGPVQNEESYLRRAAINVSLDTVRARQAECTIPLTELQSEARPLDDDLPKALRRALAGLNPRTAEIFAFRFFEGLSNQEIGRMLGMSRVLVAVTIHRARKHLRKELRSYRGGRP